MTQNIAGVVTKGTPSVDPNTNHFIANQGFTYDKNGNVVQDLDPITGHNRQFVFNGDNKQTQVKDIDNSNQVVGTYFYDGEGKRVKKVTDQETTVFVYSSGKLVAEYSTQLAAEPHTNYTTTDHLGSPRIITDELGQVKSRRDFMPFGEDVFQGVGARTAALHYSTSTDDLRQKFTGYQKDNETSLDFAEARMYENRFGRFTAVDPSLASGRSANPQSFNRYVYVSSNPISSTDPSGQCKPGECPETYNGTVYYKNIDGVMHFNNSQPNDSWKVFAGDVVRDLSGMVTGSGEYRIYNYGNGNSGWYRIDSAERGAVRALLTQTINGVSDAETGIPKGIGNSLPAIWNGLTDSLINGMSRGSGFGPLYKNRFTVPLPFGSRNAREESYMSAGPVAVGFGMGSIGSVFSSGSWLSVVPETSAGARLPVLTFDYTTHPDLAENIWHAQQAGHPRVLTWEGTPALNRTPALRGVSSYLSRDEYPFASTAEGGEGAWVGHIPGGQNSYQGWMIRNFRQANNIQPGDKFLVCVVNYPGC